MAPNVPTLQQWLGGGNEVLPGDPEFRSTLVAYPEWRSRLAVNFALPADTPVAKSLLPAGNWSLPGGPYQAETPGHAESTKA